MFSLCEIITAGINPPLSNPVTDIMFVFDEDIYLHNPSTKEVISSQLKYNFPFALSAIVILFDSQ